MRRRLELNFNMKILILDDEKSILETIIPHLEKFGFTCHYASDSEIAIEIIKQEDIDIFIVDYILVGITGIEVAEQVRKLKDGIYIILLTGYSNFMPSITVLSYYDIDSYADKQANVNDVISKVIIAAKAIKKYKSCKEDIPIHLSFGERLKYLRSKHSLKQDDVAKELGVGRTTIANYETGINEPLLRHIRKLTEIFGISYDFFVKNC